MAGRGASSVASAWGLKATAITHLQSKERWRFLAKVCKTVYDSARQELVGAPRWKTCITLSIQKLVD